MIQNAKMDSSALGGRRIYQQSQQMHQQQQLQQTCKQQLATLRTPSKQKQKCNHFHPHQDGTVTLNGIQMIGQQQRPQMADSIDSNRNTSPLRSDLLSPLPLFPPPPTYPPPSSTHHNNNNICKKSANVTKDQMKYKQHSRTLQRYPIDLDVIEFYSDHESPRRIPIGQQHQIKSTTTTINPYRSTTLKRESIQRNPDIIGSQKDPQMKWSRSNIVATMEPFEPAASLSSSSTSISSSGHDTANKHHSTGPHEYNYAYENSPSRTSLRESKSSSQSTPNSRTNCSVAGPSRPPPPNSIRALLSKGSRHALYPMGTLRHMHASHYGTQENIYEEIANDERMQLMSAGQSLISLNQTMLEEEFQRVQTRHRRILGELNLSVEEMLMPTTSVSDCVTIDIPGNKARGGSEISDDGSKDGGNLDDLLSVVGPTDELLSPASSHTIGMNGDMDSGFSGSSSGASYVDSLRYNRNSNPTRSSTPNGSTLAYSVQNSSCRSSRRSQDDSMGASSTSSGGGGSCGKSFITSLNPTKETVTNQLNYTNGMTKNKPKDSFWNRKGWRKLVIFSSMPTVNKAGIPQDEVSIRSSS